MCIVFPKRIDIKRLRSAKGKGMVLACLSMPGFSFCKGADILKIYLPLHNPF
jgi:hypothetical protein